MSPETQARALEGVRVVEAATLAAAPWIGTFLGEYGAEVIKIEPPKGGDPLRNWGHLKDGVGLMWKTIGRNKKSVTLDFHDADGREVFKKLVDTADILIVNFRPGRLEKWGLGYETLKQTNPGLIMVAVSAFGQTGPYSSRPGFGTLVEAMSGFAHITGEADGPPTLPPLPLADAFASQAGISAALAALHFRDVNGGSGQFIDISLLEPITRFMEHMLVDYDQLGLVQRRTGNKWKITVPRNTYQTSDGEWIAMSGSAPSIAERAIRAIGRLDWLEDPIYSDPQLRLAHADEIDGEFAKWIGQRTLEEAMAIFEEYEVAAAPVFSIEQLVADPHVQSREMFVRVKDDELDNPLVQAPVAHLSVTPGRIDHLGRKLGADTDDVLSRVVGLSADEIADLRQRGII